MDIFKLVGSVVIKNDDANKEIDKTQKSAESMASKIGSAFKTAGKKISDVGKSLLPVSTAMGTALTASVKSASDFTNGMAKMSTLFDTQKVSVSDLSKEFITLSNKTGLASADLAEAGYQALSAGVDVNNAVSFVETAGNLAKAGFTSTATAVDVLTTAMNAYGAEAGTAEEISNKLVRTQNLGKTTVDELASAMGKVIPTASSMGVNIDNLTSGYVMLTKQGIATAEATTYLNSMMNELGDSGTDLGEIIKDKTGMSFQECMQSGMSLADVLQVTKQYADENNIAYNELWGSAEAGKAGLSILNGGVEEFNNTIGVMASKSNDVSDALNKLDTPSMKVKKSLNQVKNAGIEFGTTIMTALAPTLEKVTSGIQKATELFTSLDSNTQKNIATAMALVAGLAPVLMIIGKIITFVGTCITVISKIIPVLKTIGLGAKVLWGILMANPIVLIIGAIVALIAGFVALWNNCEGFRQFWIDLWEKLKTVVSDVVTAVVDFFTGLWESITTTWENIKESISTTVENIKTAITEKIQAVKDTLSMIWENIKMVFQTAIQAIVTVVSTHFENIKLVVTTVFSVIQTYISTALSVVKQIIQVVMALISGDWSGAWEGIKNIFSTIWEGIKSVVTTVINTIKTIITNVLSLLPNSVTTILNNVKNVFTNVWNTIKTTVTTVITSIKNGITNGLESAKTAVSNILDGIKTKFSTIMDGAKTIVTSAVTKIKDAFDFDWKLPDLKLPHISVDGGKAPYGIGGKGSLPSFDIEWYKKAMDNPVMFTKPTLFDLNPITGTAKGAGEAGDEIMIGKESMLNMIRQASQEGNNNTDVVRLLNVLLNWFINGGFTGVLIDVLTNYVTFDFDNRELMRLVNKHA